MPATARAETVGSLLRPPYLYEARQKARDGQISESELRSVEDQAILEAIDLQKSVGLDVITDGEYRRQGWNPATSFQPNAPIEGYGPADDYRLPSPHPRQLPPLLRDLVGLLGDGLLGLQQLEPVGEPLVPGRSAVRRHELGGVSGPASPPAATVARRLR